MTIREIAQLSGVSTATVSRIMNNKTKGISDETRLRVQKIIDDNNYVSYANVRDKLLANNRTLAVIAPGLSCRYYTDLVQRLQIIATQNDYILTLFITEQSQQTEIDSFNRCLENRISGIVLLGCCEELTAQLQEAQKQGVSIVLVDFENEQSIYPYISRNMFNVAKRCTSLMLERGAKRVALLCDGSPETQISKAIKKGYREAIASSETPFHGTSILNSQNFEKELDVLFDFGVDALLCENTELAMQVYSICAMRHLSIPTDVSVMSLEDSEFSTRLLPALAAYKTEASSIATLCFESLCAQMEKQPTPFSSYILKGEMMLRRSLFHRKDNEPKIVIAGTLNIDTVIKTPSPPHPGQILIAEGIKVWPGGKGGNQAFGVSRFGAKAYMLGCVGNDRHGRRIHETLSSEGVIMDAVQNIDGVETGSAFIQVYNDGSNSIVVNSGANNFLSAEYVHQNSDLLADANFCLVQMELLFESVQALAEECRNRQVKMVLKPAPARKLTDEITEDLFLLIPNEEEICILCPERESVERKATYFIEKGVENVIVTLAEKGCVWVTKDRVERFEAPHYMCVDDTGASDVFISCLCVILAEGKSFEQAIKTALHAASYSITGEGVQNSMPLRNVL